MQKFISIGALALFFCFSFLNLSTADAQCNFTPVAKNCAGACGNPGIIEYELGPLCSAFATNFCVTNEGSNLCPSHDAIAYVFANGNLIAQGDITAVGSSLSFSALCPSKITVVVFATPNNTGIQCIQLGSVGFYLRRQ